MNASDPREPHEGVARPDARKDVDEAPTTPIEDSGRATPPASEDAGRAAGPRSVRDYLLYSLSLPERAIRTTVGVAGGAVRESAALLVPQAFQDSKTYSVLVGRGALSSTRAVGQLFDRHVFDHYRAALGDIQEKGFYRVVADTSQPYVDAVWQNFQASKTTLTEDLLSGKLVGSAAKSVSRWLGLGEQDPAEG